MKTHHNSIVNVADLQMPAYQRARQAPHVARIAAAWNPAAAGAITVSRRADGTMVILDGSHRVGAAIEVGCKTLLAIVYEGLTLAEEAAMFLELNNTRKLGAIDRFRAAVLAGETAATEINDAITALGWKVSYSSDDGNLAAVAAIEGVYKAQGIPGHAGGKDFVYEVLDVITRAWGRDRDGMQGGLIQGISSVLGRYGDQIDVDGLVDRLAKTTPNRLLGQGKSLSDALNVRVRGGVARAVVNLYNQRRRSHVVQPYEWTA